MESTSTFTIYKTTILLRYNTFVNLVIFSLFVHVLDYIARLQYGSLNLFSDMVIKQYFDF